VGAGSDIQVGGGSGSGSIQLTGDVTAGPGTGPQAATLVDTPNVQSVILANAAPTLRLIYVDELSGVDPTGGSDSSAAIITKQTALGAASYLLVFGQGVYLMNSAFVNFGPNQGLVGVGLTGTDFNWAGSGPLITATDAVFSPSARAGKFGGFQINGPYGAGTCSGISYSNLQSIVIDDVGLFGLPGGAILGANPGGGYAEEGNLTRLQVSECGAGLGAVFRFVGTSFDYTKIDAVVVVEANIDIISITGGAQMRGLNLSLRGNCHGGTGTNTGAIVAVERGNASGTGYADNVACNIQMEANDSPGTEGHYLLWMGSNNGSSQFRGAGVFNLIAAGATCQGGIGIGAPGVASGAICSFGGPTNCLDGTFNMAAGDAFALMGGTDLTNANIASLSPQAGAGGSHTINFQFGDVVGVALGYGANTLVFATASETNFARRVDVFLVQPSSGAPATVTWSANAVFWPGGVAPALSTANSAVDHIRFTYVPGTGSGTGGQGWYGELVGSGVGDLLATNNLSDVASTSAALANLGGAPLASPALTGTPTSPTNATATDATTQIATDAFVQAAITAQISAVSVTITDSGVPSSGLGLNGDYYINSATGDLYGPKTAGAWGSVISTFAQGIIPTTFPGFAGSFFLSSRWYPQETTVGGTPLLTTANQATAIPLIVGVAHTFTEIGVNCTTAGTGGNLRFGLYADNGSGYPGALIRDYGTVAATSTGALTVTASNTLAPGLYWLVEVPQGGTIMPTLNCLGSTNGMINFLFFGGAAAGTAASQVGYVLGSVSGALPNPFTAGAAISAPGVVALTQLLA
jgi:hypothetical protein